MNLGHRRDLVLMALLELVGFTVSMLEGVKRSCGRRRHNQWWCERQAIAVGLAVADVARQRAGRRGRVVQGGLRHARQTAGSALSAAALRLQLIGQR